MRLERKKRITTKLENVSESNYALLIRINELSSYKKK